ncbi:mitogen-activated protein kinase kinase kinase NPK1-like isoform X2 [Actinidia eriantha]|uniref:mitogen-activated protein kinase kinase kinase NPK1-like isoform X2 n=1 Tax=Actinidia eriantha TaxID=165200 RepID=UPI0025856074|nr:mitogen-activated protein kinase kinase kinase NPK1-like isoform X2 [Actinidia eriantha]
MQDIFGSVRRSLVFRSPDGAGEEVATSGTLVDKISYRIRKSRVFSKPCPPPPMAKDESTPIRWRKGELIGCGAFGRVYMGMNLDSGELLAVKQVLIAGNSASKEKAQTHVSELEEEVKLLKNLSHPNIVRYLGTVREDETLNILLEFVPGGSISSLLGKFGSFPESVIKMYTKQLLVGLDYLHKNGIMHRDIKGANILVDNKGCIKLADFGASKQVVELATVSGAKSMKGTPYWMAPEVILQTGHSFSADIWSVGCTVIEMATGKPPWSQQYQEVAALFYIGTTKSHPPIPEHLSHEAKDFLLKCLQKEPESRPAACELLQHLFVTGESAQSTVFCSSSMESSKYASVSCGTNQDNYAGSMDICNLGSLSCSTVNFDKLAESRHIWGANNSEDDMCQIDDKDEFVVGREEKSSSGLIPDNFNESFNPMCEPSDDWRCKDGKSLGPDVGRTNLSNNQPVEIPADSFRQSGKGDSVFSFQCTSSLSEDDDEATESKIKAFLDGKALELKKLQTPLFEEFYNSFNASCSPSFVEKARDENSPNFLKLPPKSQSPNRVPSGTPLAAVDGMNSASPGSSGWQASDVGVASHQGFQDTPSPQHNDRRGVLADADQEASPRNDAASGCGRENIIAKRSSFESTKREIKVCISRQVIVSICGSMRAFE